MARKRKDIPCVLATCQEASTPGSHGLCLKHSMRVLNKRVSGVPKDAVYVGRPGKWGNPYAIGDDGDRENVLLLYTLWLKSRIKENKGFEKELLGLLGRDLVCWCMPSPCHGEVLRDAVLWLAHLKEHPPWHGLKRKTLDKKAWKKAKRTVDMAKEGKKRRDRADVRGKQKKR